MFLGNIETEILVVLFKASVLILIAIFYRNLYKRYKSIDNEKKTYKKRVNKINFKSINFK